ncbi:MAG: hypothetical protein R2909_22535 [Gemmatimonadales bacterium]
MHLAHIKALGVDVEAERFHRRDRRGPAGQPAGHGRSYPYTASGTSPASLLPRWAEVGGRERMLKRLDDRGWPKLRSEVADNLRRRAVQLPS